MINFSALVLRPSQTTFARPITVTPLVSQPGVPAYEARGIWASKPINVNMEEGIMSSNEMRLSVRLSEFGVAIAPGDRVEIDAYRSLPRVGVCLVDDTDEDGQGGTDLTLKVITP